MTPDRAEHILEEHLSVYADGELTARERQRIERHLTTCEECREILKALQDTRVLLNNLERKPAPQLFSGRVEGRIRRRSRGRFFHRRWQTSSRTTYVGAAIILVILAALYFFSQVGYTTVRDAETGKTGQELNHHQRSQDEPPD